MTTFDRAGPLTAARVASLLAVLAACAPGGRADTGDSAGDTTGGTTSAPPLTTSDAGTTSGASTTSGAGSTTVDPTSTSGQVSTDMSSGTTGEPAPEVCGAVDLARVVPEQGQAFVIAAHFGFRGDTPAEPQHSPLVLLEDGVPLGPPHSLHDDIRQLGGGRYSHWGNSLYFSASDGSDPRTNGRAYTYAGPCRVPQVIAPVVVDEPVHFYASFQSHNQKIVANQHGIFLAYIRSIDAAELAHWVIARSTDGGRSFTPLLEGDHPTKAPVLETDAAGDVYAIHSKDHLQNDAAPALVYRLSAAKDFADPTVVELAGASAGKYSAHIDETRGQLYFFTFQDAPTPNFFVLSLDLDLKAKLALTQYGAVGVQYPHLRMLGGDLYAAWTTDPSTIGELNYRDIHFMRSDDGGASWRPTTAGAPAYTLPVVADETGPTQGIVPPDELEATTWLSNHIARAGKLHFFYYAYDGANIDRQHHVRVDIATGQRDVDTQPEWRGQNLTIKSLDGFFAADPDDPDGPLFAVSRDPAGRIVVLASDDDGVTWFDYAASAPLVAGPDSLYALGGFRRVTTDGQLLGAVTVVDGSGSGANQLLFFRVDATETLP